jgi:hypothetical protein
MELRIGYADKIGGKPADIFILNLTPAHVKIIYGSLLKERNNLASLLNHYRENPVPEGSSPARDRVKVEFENTDELISIISQVV